jgi:hypothetical protein
LRIGFSVANALAASLNIPVAASDGKAWRDAGAKNLLDGRHETPVLPDYGAEPNISTPKK